MVAHVPAHAGDFTVAVFFGFIIGGLVAAVLLVVASRLHRRLDRAIVLTSAAVMILTSAMVIETRALDRMFGGYFSFKTPRERLLEHFANFEEKVAKDPEIRRALEGFPDTSARLQLLSRLGVPRLDDRTLRERSKIMGILLSQVGEHACASIARGGAHSERDAREIKAAMLRLESGYVAAWMETLYQSMLAEARKTPAPTITPDQATAAFRALEARVGPEEAARIGAGLSPGAPDSALCRAAKAIYTIAPTLSEPHGTILLREMVARE